MVREAGPQDLKAVALLHNESFKGHFLPKLGRKLVENYYRSFLIDGNLFLLHTCDGGVINGLILGTNTYRKSTESFVRENMILLTFRTLLLVVRLDREVYSKINKFLFKRIFRKRRKADVDASSLAEVSGGGKRFGRMNELLSICVFPGVQGSGVAVELIEAYEKVLTEKEYAGYRLSVRKDNARAIGFYLKIGMSAYSESQDEQIYEKRFER